MKDFLIYLATELTGTKEIDVVEKEDNGLQSYTIYSPKDKMGLLIGKDGRTIRAIRKLAFARAIVENIKISVTVEEKD